jgi:hypothetical protein
MIDIYRDFFPSLQQFFGLLSVLGAALFFTLIGRLINSDKGLVNSSILCGWALVIFAYTAIATLSTLDLKYVVWATVATAAIAIWKLKDRPNGLAVSNALRTFALGTPFLLVVAAKWPSEVDVLSHWLYNAQYLFDNGTLPRPELPKSLSAYPGFPYNHTFLLHFASTLSGQFADTAANVVNFGLVILFAVLLARLIQVAQIGNMPASHEWRPISWTLAALALILATYANPIFVRKIVLMANPDTATSVGLAFLGIVAWQLMERLRMRDERILPWALQFSLLSVLFINMKQPNLVILLLLFASMAVGALFGTQKSWRQLARWTPLLLVPAIISYGLWRYFLSKTFALNEATLLPFSQWQYENIPAILQSMYANVIKKAGYFGVMFFLTGWAIWHLKRPRNDFDRLAMLATGVFLGWNGFLFFLYFAHWTGHASTGASSYWRYNTFIGYFGYAVFVYGIARLVCHGHLQPLFDRLALCRLTVSRKHLGYLVVTIAIVMPVVTAPYLRFDREQPKPYLRKIGIELGDTLPKGTRVLVHIPGDAGDYATVMQYFGNRYRMDMSVAPAPVVPTIKRDIEIPYPSIPMVWAFCRSVALERYHGIKLPKNSSILLERVDGTWRIRQSWPHPSPERFSRFHKNFNRIGCNVRP